MGEYHFWNYVSTELMRQYTTIADIEGNVESGVTKIRLNTVDNAVSLNNPIAYLKNISNC